MHLSDESIDDCFTVTPASPHRKKIQRGPGGNRRNSSQSEPSSEADSAVDSPLSEPLNVDVSYIKTWERGTQIISYAHMIILIYSSGFVQYSFATF
jgi:hypothetical protein